MRQTDDENIALADRLHSAAIHLLRRLRVHDAASGLTARRLSALSVIVFGGPLTMTDLAEAEQVSPPTISRLVKELEWEGLVERSQGVHDKRVQRVKATEKGRALLQEGRERRVTALAEEIASLPVAEREILTQAAPILERLTLPPEHPNFREAE